jgi:hypothetical protein
MAAANSTEASFMFAFSALTADRENRPIGNQVFFAFYPQGIGVRREVNRITTSTTRFSAN